jgi:MFS family permease
MKLDVASTYFFVVLALFAIVARLVTGHIYDRFGANYAIYPAIFLLSLGLFILGNPTASLGVFSASAIIGFAYGMCVPSLLALSFKNLPHIELV